MIYLKHKEFLPKLNLSQEIILKASKVNRFQHSYFQNEAHDLLLRKHNSSTYVFDSLFKYFKEYVLFSFGFNFRISSQTGTLMGPFENNLLL